MQKSKPKQHQVKAPELKNYLNYLSQNKTEAYIAIGFYFLFGVVMYICYPYTDIMQDSGGYINWGHPKIRYGGPRPLGYSYFLTSLRSIYIGTGIIFFVQYIIFCLSAYFFYSSSVYIFSINNRYIRYIYLAISLVFISGLYAANMIMSDSLFSSLSLLFITVNLWLIYKPDIRLVIIAVLLLTAIITIRYIGLIYPLILIPVLFISFKKKAVPVITTLFIALFTYGYVEKIEAATDNEQGVAVFSAFSGWQQANNALHLVPHVDISMPLIDDTSDSDLAYIDYVVRETYKYNKHLYPGKNEVHYAFIWVDSLPLRLALNNYRTNSRASYYSDWNRMGKRYSEYGNLLIKKYFPEYIRYYILNNVARLFHPPVEIFESYNQLNDMRLLNIFFNWKEGKKIEPENDFLRPILLQMSWLYTIYWLMFGIAVIFFTWLWLFKRRLYTNEYFKLILLLVIFVVVYAAANVYGAPVNLRFLMPIRPLMLGLFFIMLSVLTGRVWVRRESKEGANTTKS